MSCVGDREKLEEEGRSAEKVRRKLFFWRRIAIIDKMCVFLVQTIHSEGILILFAGGKNICVNLLCVPQPISWCASKYFFVCFKIFLCVPKILAKSSPKDLICEILQRFFFCGKYSNFLIGIRHIICIVGIPHRDILNSPFTIVIPCMCGCVQVCGGI